jgi:hypothetical protein
MGYFHRFLTLCNYKVFSELTFSLNKSDPPGILLDPYHAGFKSRNRVWLNEIYGLGLPKEVLKMKHRMTRSEDEKPFKYVFAMMGMLKIPVLIGDGESPVLSQGAMGDLHARGALSAFILISVDHLDHFFDHAFLETHL